MPVRSGQSVLLAAGVLLAVALSVGAIALLNALPRAGDVGAATGRPAQAPPPSGRVGESAGSGAPGSVAPSPPASTSPTGSLQPAAGPANLAVSTAVVRPWVDALGEVRAQVLVGVTNSGGAPGFLPAAGTRYRVLSPAGQPVAEGRFAHVFPPYVEPGATAWFVDTLSATFADGGELGSVEVQLTARPAEPGDAASTSALSVSETQWELDAGGSVAVSGIVSNVGEGPVGRVSVGVILLGHDGAPLAGAYDVSDVHDLAPGASAPFSTSYPGSPPLRASDVARYEAFAVVLNR